MKKRKESLLVVLLLCASLSLAGCTSGTSSDSGTEEETQEETAETGSGEDDSSVDFGVGLDDDGRLTGIEDVNEFVTLPDYANAVLAAADVEVSDEEVQEEIDSLLESYAETTAVTDRAVQDGDVVNIDYVGSVDGVEFDGGSAEGYDLTIGSGTFIDGFEDAIIGHETGEVFDIDVTFPENYASEDLAGVDAVFSITLNSITETVTPELTDDFVAETFSDSYGYETAQEVWDSARGSLETERHYDAVWAYLTEESVFEEVPESVIEDVLQTYINYYTSYAESYGMTLDEYLEYFGVDGEEGFREEMYDLAVETAEKYLIAEAVADAEGLVVDDEMAVEYCGEDNYDSFVEYYGNGYLKMQIRLEKVADLVFETAEIQ